MVVQISKKKFETFRNLKQTVSKYNVTLKRKKKRKKKTRKLPETFIFVRYCLVDLQRVLLELVHQNGNINVIKANKPICDKSSVIFIKKKRKFSV